MVLSSGPGLCEHGAGFEIVLVHAGRFVFVLEDEIGAPERLFDGVARLNEYIGGHVSVTHDVRKRCVIVQGFVQERGVFLHGVVRREHGGERLVVDADFIERGLCGFGGFGGHGGHALADIEHLVDGQQRFIAHESAVAHDRRNPPP